MLTCDIDDHTTKYVFHPRESMLHTLTKSLITSRYSTYSKKNHQNTKSILDRVTFDKILHILKDLVGGHGGHRHGSTLFVSMAWATRKYKTI